MRVEEQRQAKAIKAIDENNKGLKKMLEIKERIKDHDKEQLKTLDEMIRKKQKLIDMDNDKLIVSAAKSGMMKDSLNKMDGTKNKIPDEDGDPKPGSLKAGMLAKMVAGFAGSAAAGISMYGQYRGYMSTREREIQGARGSQVQNANIGFQSTMQGQGFQNQFESKEREKAMRMALEERSSRLGADPIKAVGKVLLDGIMGAGIGAAAGSAVPVIGTGLGAVAGGIGSMAKGIMGDKGLFQQIFDRDAYMENVNAETFQNFRSNLANIKMQDPEKFAGMEQFGKRQQQFQSTQRRLNLSDRDLLGHEVVSMKESAPTRNRAGVGEKGQVTRIATRDGEFGPGTKKGQGYQVESDESFQDKLSSYDAQSGYLDAQNKTRKKGFLESQMSDRSGNAAFSEERINKNMSDILNAGGSSAFVKNGMGGQIAAEYQRAGYTDAAQQLGAISGQGVADTEQAYIKLLAEGMALGINQSELPEESRRFANAAIELYTSSQGAEGAVSTLASGIVGADSASMEAAKSAFGRMNEEAGQDTGMRGALKQSYLRSAQGKKEFGGLSENMRQHFTTTDLKNLDKDDMMVQRFRQAIQKEEGFEGDENKDKATDEALKRIAKLQRYGLNLNKDTDDSNKKFGKTYNNWLAKNNKQDGVKTREEFSKSEEGIAVGAENFATTGMERSGDWNRQKSQEKEATNFLMSGLPDFKSKKGSVGLKGTGRAADDAEGSTAKDQMTQLAMVNTQLEKLTEAFNRNGKESIENLMKVVTNTAKLELLENIRKTDEDTLKAILGNSNFNFGNMFGGGQPNTGKGKK